MAIATLEIVGESLSRTAGVEAEVLTRLTGLEARYSEPWRHYHVLEHPLELFDILTANLDVVRDPEVVGWSMMYHDAVYDPTSTIGRNEELSARLSESELPPIIGGRYLVAGVFGGDLWTGNDQSLPVGTNGRALGSTPTPSSSSQAAASVGAPNTGFGGSRLNAFQSLAFVITGLTTLGSGLYLLKRAQVNWVKT